MIDHSWSAARERRPTPTGGAARLEDRRGRAARSPIDDDVAEMVVNRIIDNAGVAAAALDAPARRHRARPGDSPTRRPRRDGATVLGCRSEVRVSPEWAAWANGVAVRELDFHDTFLAAEYAHPGDNIPPIVAVAQHRACGGDALARDRHGVRDPGRPGPVDLPARAQDRPHRPPRPVGRGRARHTARPADRGRSTRRSSQALHTTTTTRQSRKGAISVLEGLRAGLRRQDARSRRWTGRCAARARRRRSTRARTASSPGCSTARTRATWCRCPQPGEAKRRHPRDLHQGALGRVPGAGAHRPRPAAADPRSATLERIAAITIYTSHHTHNVIGTGANDPQKIDPDAQPGDPRPLADVHLRRRARGRALAPRALVPARASAPPVDGRALAQDPHRRGPRVDAPLPQRRPPRRPSAGGSSSSFPTARCSRTRSRSPTPIRSALVPSAARVRREVPTLAEGVDRAGEQQRFLELVQRLAALLRQLDGLSCTPDGSPHRPGPGLSNGGRAPRPGPIDDMTIATKEKEGMTTMTRPEDSTRSRRRRRRHDGHLDGQRGDQSLLYRGYPVQELAAPAASRRSPT